MENTIMQSAFFCLIIILLRNGNLSTAEVLSNSDDNISPLKRVQYDKNGEVNKGAITRVKRQFGYPYDPYNIRPPIPIIIGGGGIGFGVFGQRGFGGRGFGGWGFGGRGFGGRGFGGRGFGGRGFGGRGFGGRGIGGRGFGGFGGRGGRG